MTDKKADKMYRVKFQVIPYDEQCMVIAKGWNTMNDLQQIILNELSKFPLYQQTLKFYDAILELRSSGEDYALSGVYLINEILIDSDDIIVVKFIQKNSQFYRLQPHAIGDGNAKKKQ